jgi:hypothetical protein
VRFEVTDPDGLESALDAREDLERDDEGASVWHWSGVNRSGEGTTGVERQVRESSGSRNIAERWCGPRRVGRPSTA